MPARYQRVILLGKLFSKEFAIFKSLSKICKSLGTILIQVLNDTALNILLKMVIQIILNKESHWL